MKRRSDALLSTTREAIAKRIARTIAIGKAVEGGDLPSDWVMPVEGRDLSSRQTQYVVKDLEIGQPINSASVQKLKKASHANA
jgi:hypothetical protein